MYATQCYAQLWRCSWMWANYSGNRCTNWALPGCTLCAGHLGK